MLVPIKFTPIGAHKPMDKHGLINTGCLRVPVNKNIDNTCTIVLTLIKANRSL